MAEWFFRQAQSRNCSRFVSVFFFSSILSFVLFHFMTIVFTLSLSLCPFPYVSIYPPLSLHLSLTLLWASLSSMTPLPLSLLASPPPRRALHVNTTSAKSLLCGRFGGPASPQEDGHSTQDYLFLLSPSCGALFTTSFASSVPEVVK